MRIVVAGGTGFLGTPLVSLLARDGHEVVVLTRGTGGADAANRSRVAWTPNGESGAWASVIDGAAAVKNPSAWSSRFRRRWAQPTRLSAASISGWSGPRAPRR